MFGRFGVISEKLALLQHGDDESISKPSKRILNSKTPLNARKNPTQQLQYHAASAWLCRERCERCEAVERTDRTSSWHCGWEKAEEQLGLISIMVDLQYVDYVVYGL